MWDAVREGLGAVLAFFYSIIPNSGVAIILLTIAVRLALFPLTAKQAKSMIAMQRVQPEIKKLQAKYKNDRQKLNEEMMKFYKENEINPLGGCLPLLLQMPVFIALFQTLRDIQKFIPKNSQMYADICSNKACKPPHMKFAGMNLTVSASKASHLGFVDMLPYLVLVAIVVATGFVQQRQTMRNQTQTNPQMAIIGKVFPLVFAFISWGLPSGVGLYFATSNLWQIGQQEYTYRKFGSAAGPPPKKKGQAAIEGSKGGDPSGETKTAVKEPDPKPPKGSNGTTKSPAKGSSRGGGRPPDSKNTPGKSQGGQDRSGSGGARSNRKRKR